MLTGPQHRTTLDELLVDDAWVRRLVEDGQARWVVVDDLYADRCELAISPWPRLTDAGLLTFATSEEEHVVADVDALWLLRLVSEARRLQYADEDVSPEVLDRPLRVGDTFAAWITVAAAADVVVPPGGKRAEHVAVTAGANGIGDVSAQSRVFAKVQVAVADGAPIDTTLLPDFRQDIPER